MTRGSWEDVRAHGAKRLLPYFSGMQRSRIGVATDWAPKTINNARVATLGSCRMAVADGLMAHNPVLDVKPLAIEFTERRTCGWRRSTTTSTAPRHTTGRSAAS